MTSVAGPGKSNRRAALSALAAVATVVVAMLPLGAGRVDAATPPAALDSAPECTIVGSPGPDELVGTPGDDVICGRGGNDELRGKGGDDELRGGDGADELSGGNGADLARGQLGKDVVTGGVGDDELRGGKGNDNLDSRDASGIHDLVKCGPGTMDRAFADMGDDVVSGCEVINQNDPPTNIELQPSTVAENSPVGTLVGNLNATDPDPGDKHTYTLVPGSGSGDNGSFTIDGKKLLTATVFDFEGDPTKSIRVRATDIEGASFVKILTVSVTDLKENKGPLAVDDTRTTPEDTVLVLPVSGAGSPAANDTDPDGDALTVLGVSGAVGGTATLTAGTIRFTPALNLCGPAAGRFDYTVSDGHDGIDTGRVTVDITCVNDAPVAVDDSATVTEDDPASAIDVLANDTDAEGNAITIDSVTQPDNGTVVITGGGTGLTYGPDPDYCNSGAAPDDTFSYTINGGDTATVSVTVTCVDDAPAAVDDSANVSEDDPAAAVDVLANDTDIDGGPISIDSVTQPANGTVVITGGGTGLTYGPDADYCNDPPGTTTDDFTYTLIPGGSTATVSVTVDCVDDGPVAVDDTLTVTEDDPATSIDVRANDTDIDGGPISIDSVTQPANGSVAITGPGTGLTYQPDPNYCNAPPGNTPDSFTYTLTPGGSTATVSVTVTCVGDAPVAVDDSATVTEDAPATAVDVLANDSDADGDPITIDSVTQPANGAVVITGAGTGLTYGPDPDYCNNPPGTTTDTFTYTINGGDTATVSVTVTCVDDAPVAVDDTLTVLEDDPATLIDVRANDTDLDGGPMTVGSVTQPANGSVLITTGGLGVTYEPDANYCNDPGPDPADTFTYTLNGGSTATVSVTVTCVDDAAVAVDDAATVDEDDPATAIDVLANDTDVEGDAITIDSVTQPANGTVVITGGGTGLTYQPDPNYCNDPGLEPADTFTYTVNGGSTATVSVTVTCVNDAPVAVDDAATVTEDDPATAVDALANDTDVDGDAVTIDSVTQPANGTVVITGAGTGLTYEPDPDYCNSGAAPDDTFTYTINGGDTATVSVTVTCVNDDPVAVDDSATVTEDDNATAIDVLADDTDVDGDAVTIESVTQPDNGTVVITGAGTGLTYEPDPDYCNDPGPEPADTFTYTINGGSTATVSVTVTCVNDDPVAVDDTATVTEDDPATAVDVLANDTDAEGDPITIDSVTQPTNGAAVITGAGTGLTYEPDPDYCNSGAAPDDTFTYTINGGDTATVSVTVTCVNDDPVAVDDSATVTLNDPATAIDVLTNDTDADGDAITIESVTQPANGAVVITGAGTGLTYEPDADFCDDDTPDTFTYTINGGSTATVSVTVACDVPPTAVDDTATFAEDDPATTIDVLANDTDPDTGPISVQSVTQPANGTVVITNGGDDLTYEPNANYCNTPPGTSPDTFTYTLAPGGSTATVSVSVTCSDDAPVAVDDSATVLEDANATAVDVLANDTDVDGGPKLITSASDPTNGTVVLTGGGTGLTYQPDPNYCNSQAGGTPDTFTYTVNGGDTATVTVTVTCVADPPTIDNSAGATSYTENDPATVVDGSVTITNLDGLTITAGSVNISDGFAAGQDVLDWVDNNLADTITEGASTNQTLLLTGDGTAAQYEAALEAVTYRNTSDDPSTAPRTITFSIATSAGSPSDTKGVTVSAVPDAPTAVNDSATVAEDAAATAVDVLANDTDPDAGPKTISSASDPANGIVVLTGGSAGAHTGLTYQPDPNYCNDPGAAPEDTFSYSLNGGSTATVSVTVTCAPDNPVVDTSAGSTSYTENAAATVIDAGVTVSDVDAGTTITGATVEITGNYAGAEDVLALANPGSHPLITPSVVGDTLTLTGTASVAAYQAALRDATYRNSSENPSTLPRTVTFTVTDDTARSGSDTKGLTVSAVDDPPVAVNDSATVLEDAAATAVTVLTNDTDVDAGPKSIASVTQPANGTVLITGGGTGLTYQPNANYCNNPPGTTLSTFTYTLNGGSTATVSMTVTCVNDAPVADDETFNGTNSAVGNTALVVNDPDDAAPTLNAPKKSISGDILAGDTDIDSGPLTVTPVTNALTTDGGRVTIEADGDFIYVSDPADACADASDSFNYTVEDSGTPELTDTGTVTIAVTGCVWYVNNNDPTGNAGTSVAPFDTLAQAQTASLATHTIFVFDGDNTSTGYDTGFNLKAGQVLTSEAANLVVGTDTLWTAIAANRPTLTDNNADVVDLDDGTTVRGFVIDPQGTGGGIAGTTGDTGGGTIDNVFIQDAGTRGTQPGLELDATTGTFNVSDLTVNNGDANNATSGDIGVRLNNAGTVVFAPTGTISVTTQSARALDLTGTALGTSTFDEITVTSSGSGGLSLVNTTGTIALGDDAVADISLTTNGATAAFLLNNPGTVTVGAAGTDSIFATNGPAIDITGPAGGLTGSFAFDDTDSTSSGTDGINLDNFGTATFTTGSGSAITGAAGIGFDLNQGTANVTYDGTINTSAATSRPVEVTNRGGGTVDFNGTVTGTGLGINLATNPSATIRFDGGLSLTTTGNTTGDTAFNATGGGTIAVTDPNAVGTAPDNTLSATSAAALNVVSTNIGADDLNFRSISAGNSTAATDPANGIVLNGTGTAVTNGGLVVTGTGGTCNATTPTCTGGHIQSLVGADNSSFTPGGTGIVLTSTRDTSLSSMRIRNASNYAIRGNQTTNFTLANLLIDGTNGTNEATPFSDGSISFDTILGTNSITGSEISGGWQRNIRVDHASGVGGGTMTLNVTGNNIHDTVGTAPDDGVFVEAENTDNYTVNVSNNTLQNHGGDHVNITMINSATIAVSITGNTLQNPTNPVRLGGGIFVFGASWNGTGTYVVSNNSILRNRQGGAIHMNKGSGTATMSGSITNNTIGTTGVNQSGSIEASGIVIGARGASGTHTTLIEDNNIFGWNDRAIVLENGEGNSTLNATVRGNTANTFDSINGLHGLHVSAGILAADAGSVCLDAGGALVADRNHLTLAGNEPAGGADIRVRRGSAVNLRMPGYAGGADDDAAVTTYLTGRNDVTTVSVTSPGTGTYSGGAACPVP